MIGKIPFKPKIGFVLPRHRFTGPCNPLQLQLQLDSKDNPLPGNEPYYAVDATSMRNDICYRYNPAGKIECDRKMLAELNTLVPKGRRENVDRLLVRTIIGLKHRLGMGVWSNQLANKLHKPVRRRRDKRSVFAKQFDDIWAADLVEMSSFFRSNKGYKYLLTIIHVYSKYGWIVPLKTKTGKEVAQAFRKLFRNGHPNRVWTDKGMEFYNRQLKGVLEANGVMLYSTENEEKSSVVERWNRMMKNIMWKYFTVNSTQKYIYVLPSMVDKYNSTYHRSIKLMHGTHQTISTFTISKLSEMPWKCISQNMEKNILAGDFNAEVSEVNLSNFLDIYGLKSLVHEKTCYKSIENPSCIDLILTNCSKSFQKTNVISSGISDFHKRIVTVMQTTFPKTKPRQIFFRNYKYFDDIIF